MSLSNWNMDPRRTEYRLQTSLATSLYYRHCFKEHEAMFIHEGLSESSPDIVLIDREGALWIYELKRGRLSGQDGVGVLCQALSYARDYSDKSPADLAQQYCKYVTEMGRGLLGRKRLAEYDDLLPSSKKDDVFKADLTRWFGTAPATTGRRISRVGLVAQDWDPKALSLIEQIKTEGVVASLRVIRSARAPNTAKWTDRVLSHAGEMESFIALMHVECLVDPADWIRPAV